MPIIDPKCFELKYLKDIQAQFKAQDPQMLERCVLALELVGRLQQNGLDFIFKGGTCLLLHLPQPKRLSIDVDIICRESLDRLKEVLAKVVLEKPFTDWNYQVHRERDDPPTKHFEVFYNSVINSAGQDKILIDVIKAKNPYADLSNKLLVTPFILPVEEVRILLPSVSSLLGDKLAAFAPATIGFPYEPIDRKGNPAELRPANVVKHLFDVNQLTMLADNLANTIKTYKTVYHEQLRYRGGKYTREACLADSQQAAIWISQVERLNSSEEDSKIDFFRRGINSVASHMFAESFGRSEARVAASRASLIAEIVKNNIHDFPLKEFLHQPLNTTELKAAKLLDEWAPLERLMKTDPQAYVCWVKAQQLGKSKRV